MPKTQEVPCTAAAQSGHACGRPNPRACMNCAFAYDGFPYAYEPRKAYCFIYPQSQEKKKPDYVYFGGADCYYHEEML